MKTKIFAALILIIGMIGVVAGFWLGLCYVDQARVTLHTAAPPAPDMFRVHVPRQTFHEPGGQIWYDNVWASDDCGFAESGPIFSWPGSTDSTSAMDMMNKALDACAQQKKEAKRAAKSK
jgi:hypothetical protein